MSATLIERSVHTHSEVKAIQSSKSLSSAIFSLIFCSSGAVTLAQESGVSGITMLASKVDSICPASTAALYFSLRSKA